MMSALSLPNQRRRRRVTDEAHFTDDLGADWLDRLELMIVIEDRFADVVITDEEVDEDLFHVRTLRSVIGGEKGIGRTHE